MNRKTFMAIHTYISEKTKRDFLEEMPKLERTDIEWREMYTFEKCRCVATWVGTDDFFFCHWQAETEEDIMITLTENGMDENLITVAYLIIMHINKNECSGCDPYQVWADVKV